MLVGRTVPLLRSAEIARLDGARLLRFGAIYMVNSTAVAAVSVAFSVIHSQELFGNIALALRICLVPVGFSNAVFSPILLSSFLHSSRLGRRDDFSLALKGTNAKLMVVSIVTAAFMLSSRWWFGYLYPGEQWGLAPICLAILAPLTIVQMCVSPKSDLLFVVGRERAILQFDVLRVVLSMLIALALILLDGRSLTILVAYMSLSVALFLWLARSVSGVTGSPASAA